MNNKPQDFLSPGNLRILNLREQLNRDLLLNPELAPWWLRPCKVRALLVVDGLDFSTQNFGLSTFVTTLLDLWHPARFEVTLAHLGRASGAAMMDWEPRIARRLSPFAFDDPDQFGSKHYDVVFLFGIAVTFNRTDENGRTRLTADGQPYPNDGLAPGELQAIGTFMNEGGGLFATGDHGRLGRFMGRDLPRARDMRLWDHTVADPVAEEDIDEVSMGGEQRNDTNRPGNPGSQFDDQSDDTPQVIRPKLYSSRTWLWEYTYPHPLLCGPHGVIRVMPDHPHEGECKEPDDIEKSIGFTADLGQEFPPGTGGGARPLPEVISQNDVLAGTLSGKRIPTKAHSFGGIAAYDGHRAGVGRVVTDATWHHFVNVNLVGINYLPGQVVNPDYDHGFLKTPTGQAHLDEIKAYYRNLGVWLSRSSNIGCMNRRWLLELVRSERVMEAVLTTPNVRIDQLSLSTLLLLGRHARDVLGRFASACQTQRLIIDLIWSEFRIPIPEIDPWWPVPDPGPSPFGRGPTWINFDLAFDAALGAALASVNEAVPQGREDRLDEETVIKAATTGARHGFAEALRGLEQALGAARNLTDRLAGR